MFEVVGDLSPVGQLQRLHRRVLHVHVGVHTVAHQRLHDGVLRGREEEIRPELKLSTLQAVTSGDQI